MTGPYLRGKVQQERARHPAPPEYRQAEIAAIVKRLDELHAAARQGVGGKRLRERIARCDALLAAFQGQPSALVGEVSRV